MNIIKRTCANCAAFNPSATDNEEVCGNLVFFTEHHGTPQAVSREPRPADCCDGHQTHEEDAAETLALVHAGAGAGGVAFVARDLRDVAL